MAGTKRKHPTTDDLMRRQETHYKRHKRSTSPSSSEDRIDSAEDVSGLKEEEGVSSPGEDDDDLQDGMDDDWEADEGLDSHMWEDTAGSRISLMSKSKALLLASPATASLLKPTSFVTLGISPGIIASMAGMSIRTPTEIQTACVPPLLSGRDCIGNAKTGSGKTIAFALPILQQLSVDPYGIYALVLTPTRELAFQIRDQFAVLGAPLNIHTAVIVGGMDMMAQAIELNNRPHVVVATPGRIVDHLRSSSAEWDLSRVKFLVLDEADRLLTPTFAEDLAHLFGVLPRDRQTALFTATWTPSIESIADAPPRPGKQKPFVHKSSAMVETVETLKQYYILVPSHVREPYLFHLLTNTPAEIEHMRRAAPETTKATRKGKQGKGVAKKKADEETVVQPPPTMIFCGRARTAAYLTNLLQMLGIRSTALHSRLTQRERLSSLQLFRSSVVPVLVCTNVGARGLDMEDVALVVNWDLPNEAEEYTHRVGRTARAGRKGMSISFVSEKDEERVLKIEKRIGTKLEEMEMPEGKVLERLNAVSTAKRQAYMELHDSKFGKREEIQQAKKGGGGGRSTLLS